MPSWLRWILVLPGALGAYLAVQLLIGLSSEQLPAPDQVQDWYSQAVNSVMGPWAFVYAGAQIAPRGRRFPTSVTLAVVFGVFTGAIAALALVAKHLSHPIWWLAVSAVVGIITVIVTCIQVQKAERAEHGSALHQARGA